MKKGGWFLIGALVVGLAFTGCSDISGLFDDIFGDVFGTDADSGSDYDYGLSTYWSQDQWETWFNNHPYSDSDARNAVTTFRSKNSDYVSYNPWWEDMHTDWINGFYVSRNPSTNLNQAQWYNWFNSHSPSNTSDVNAVHTFYSGDSYWAANTSWWLTLYADWASGASFGTNPFEGTWSNGNWGTITFNADFTVSSWNLGGSPGQLRNGIYICTGTTATVTLGGESSRNLYMSNMYNDSFYWDGIQFSKNP